MPGRIKGKEEGQVVKGEEEERKTGEVIAREDKRKGGRASCEGKGGRETSLEMIAWEDKRKGGSAGCEGEGGRATG